MNLDPGYMLDGVKLPRPVSPESEQRVVPYGIVAENVQLRRWSHPSQGILQLSGVVFFIDSLSDEDGIGKNDSNMNIRKDYHFASLFSAHVEISEDVRNLDIGIHLSVVSILVRMTESRFHRLQQPFAGNLRLRSGIFDAAA